jgi:hypothetical protein
VVLLLALELNQSYLREASSALKVRNGASFLRELDTSALEYRDVLLAFPYWPPLRAVTVLIAALSFPYPPVSQSHPDKLSFRQREGLKKQRKYRG